MATTASVKILKTMPFKGGTRTWSNRYHFDGGAPADDTKWHTLMDAIVTAEKASLHPKHTIVEAIGYGPGSDVPVSSKVYSTVGTASLAGTIHDCPGEVVALVRCSTAARSTKNHPIYCFSYIHGVIAESASSAVGDNLGASMRTQLGTYHTSWITGFSDGAVTHHRASPNGAVCTAAFVEEYLTHRDFPHTPSL
jgi:hypothetical protein